MSRVGASLAELNATSPPVGEVGIVRLSASENEMKFIFDGIRWTSRPIRNILMSNDQEWMQTTQQGWGYFTASPGTNPSGWSTLRPIPNVKLMYQAGFKLQDRLTGRMRQVNNGVVGRIVVGYFTYDDGSPIVFTNDHSLVVHPVVPYIECATTQGQTWAGAGNPVTLAVDDTSAFLAGPSFISVEGIQIYYTAKTGNSFTGLQLSSAQGGQRQKFGTFGVGAVVRQAFGTDFPMSPEGIGMGSIVAATNFGIFRYQSNWQDVQFQVFNRNGEPQKPVVPLDIANLKTDLYPTVYATCKGGTLQTANLIYEMRWISA